MRHVFKRVSVSKLSSNQVVVFQLLVVANSYNSYCRGGSRANLKEGQSVVGALKNFQKLVTRVRCIQRFSDPFSEKTT